MTDAQHLVFRQGLQVQVQLGRKGQRAFRPDQKMRQVRMGLWAVQGGVGPGPFVGAARHQRVDVVPADPAHQIGEALLDVIGFAPADGQQVGDHVLLFGRQACGRCVRRQFAELHGLAVHGDGVDGADVVAHRAVDDGARTAGIVPGHAADRRAGRGRDVDREPQAVRFQVGVQMIQHQARLHQGLAARGVEIENLVQVLGQVDDQRLAHRLPALRGAAAPGQDRHAFVAGDVDDGLHVLGVFRHDDAEWFDLIDRGVGGIAAPGERIEQDRALDRTFQAARQGGIALIPAAVDRPRRARYGVGRVGGGGGLGGGGKVGRGRHGRRCSIIRGGVRASVSK